MNTIKMIIREPRWLCYEYALNYIYHYPKTESELKIKLLQKWYDEYDVDQSIAYLKTKWYVDDLNFTECYVNSEVVKKWKPLFLVKQKLFQKWVAKDIIAKITEKLKDDVSDGIATRIRKEIDAYKKKDVEGFDIIQKLIRKWYNLDDIKRVIKGQ